MRPLVRSLLALGLLLPIGVALAWAQMDARREAELKAQMIEAFKKMQTEKQRPGNEFEFIYATIAEEIGAPELCARIHPDAEHGLGFNPPGLQIYYLQSRCYFDVAIKTRDRALCDKVRSLSRLPFVDGSKISQKDCVAEIGRNAESLNPGSRFFNAKPVLMKMGYTKETIPAAIIRSENDESLMWLEFYRSIAMTPGFRARLSRLPDFSRTAAVVSMKECDPHFIKTRSPQQPPHDIQCCPDFDSDGRCDAEAGPDASRLDDLVLEPVQGRPPRILCGDQPLRIEVRLRNKGAQAFPQGSAWVEIVNLNPLMFGVAKADLQIPIPGIPPGGATTMAFPPLRPTVSADPSRRLRYSPRLLMVSGHLQGGPVLDFDVEAEAANSPRCVAGVSQRP